MIYDVWAVIYDDIWFSSKSVYTVYQPLEIERASLGMPVWTLVIGQRRACIYHVIN